MARERYYETMFIMKTSVTEEKRNEVVETVKGWLTDKVEATIEKEERWGVRKLAYRVPKGKLTDGDYAYFIYKASPEKINVLEDLFGINQEVFRFQTFRREDLEKSASKKEANITVEEPVETEEVK